MENAASPYLPGYTPSDFWLSLTRPPKCSASLKVAVKSITSAGTGTYIPLGSNDHLRWLSGWRKPASSLAAMLTTLFDGPESLPAAIWLRVCLDESDCSAPTLQHSCFRCLCPKNAAGLLLHLWHFGKGVRRTVPCAWLVYPRGLTINERPL